MIETFLKDIDKHLSSQKTGRLHIHLVGSTALFLQSEFRRETKDSDIIEVADNPSSYDVILDLAGRGRPLAKKHRMYIEVLKFAFPFLPPKPIFHELRDLNKELECLHVSTLDVTDVVVSKLAPFRAHDVNDIRAIIDLGLLDHARLISRFELAFESWKWEARAHNLRKCLNNLNTIERDFFLVTETNFELPSWVE